VLRWPFSKPKPPLSGAPASPRLKTYSAASGYVYGYLSRGRRASGRGAEAGLEFAFRVSADNKRWLDVSVFVPDSVLRSWEDAHGRTLTPTERYAVAKLTLFAAFDECPAPAALRAAVYTRPSAVEGILEALDL